MHLEMGRYLDSDFTRCVGMRKSTYRFFLFAEGGVSSRSFKQTIVALSTMKAEFIACYEATIHAL